MHSYINESMQNWNFLVTQYSFLGFVSTFKATTSQICSIDRFVFLRTAINLSVVSSNIHDFFPVRSDGELAEKEK